LIHYDDYEFLSGATMAGEFRKLLESSRIIVFDGAMGTELAARGVEPGTAANLTASETVLAVHRACREAGAEVLITNTFDVNRQLLADRGVRTKLESECHAACEIAREAAAGGGFIAGDMGPTGALLEPHGTTPMSEMQVVFLETAMLLAKCGVDLFIVETMSDDHEMMLAVRACRAVAERARRDIPIAASMAFDPSRQGGFRTNMGVSPAEAARAMVEAGADIIGANCGSVTPEQMAEIVREFRRATDKPILIQPNAGVPELQAGKTIFRLAPKEFADGMKHVLEASARLVGGCCGTTPEHIRCLRRAVEEWKAQS
jgi:5-methyltetrahydrofolate--homocysteine methyltransferase